MTAIEETYASTTEPVVLERFRAYATYFQSVSNTIFKFRESFGTAYDVKGAHSRSSRRQVSMELSSILNGLECTYPVPEPSETLDLKFSRTNWNSRARLQAVCEGMRIVAEMLQSVADEREKPGVSPLEIHGRVTAVKLILATLLALIDDL
ncbi:hypothetical protein [Rhizobium tubonense]|uniref:Uncharacterized protein n=1 Tax=Rhizobium tubonense TaxID=484088 RepID=A0A2W4E6U2_9HYPH|nr:hypothetical protein [Rhizobium tubonense]PZM08083.1 hypothetical protein CPY51_30540 [Rhizobium tubonense]